MSNGLLSEIWRWSKRYCRKGGFPIQTVAQYTIVFAIFQSGPGLTIYTTCHDICQNDVRHGAHRSHGYRHGRVIHHNNRDHVGYQCNPVERINVSTRQFTEVQAFRSSQVIFLAVAKHSARENGQIFP